MKAKYLDAYPSLKTAIAFAAARGRERYESDAPEYERVIAVLHETIPADTPQQRAAKDALVACAILDDYVTRRDMSEKRAETAALFGPEVMRVMEELSRRDSGQRRTRDVARLQIATRIGEFRQNLNEIQGGEADAAFRDIFRASADRDLVQDTRAALPYIDAPGMKKLYDRAAADYFEALRGPDAAASQPRSGMFMAAPRAPAMVN